MKHCNADEVINPHTKRCIKINGAAFKKIDLSLFSKEDQDKVSKFKKTCKADQAYNPLTKRCISKKGQTYKTLVKQKIIVSSPQTHQTVSPPKSTNLECKNDSTFLMMTKVNDIGKNDFIKLSNGYCFSIEEIEALLSSDTFKNINPHNQSTTLFDMQKDKEVLLTHPNLFNKVQKAVSKLSNVNTKDLTILYNHIDQLYHLCKLAGLVIFDNYGSFSKQSESFNLSLNSLVKFNELLEQVPTSKRIIYGLKHPKTNDTVKSIINSCNQGTVCIHKAGSLLLQIFIFWFMKLEKENGIVYDIAKGKVIFTKVVDNRLYFRQVNSHEIRDTGTIYLTDILTTPTEFKQSSLFKNNSEHLKYKCKRFTETCVNKDDLYLYTNNYDANTWCDFKDTQILKLSGNYCFGLDYILEYMNNKLNSSNMNNPAPAYPLNPFTNRILTKKDLKKIKKLVLLFSNKSSATRQVFLRRRKFLDRQSC